MNDIVLVNVVHCFADLSHENRASFLRQNEFVVQDSIEQFTTVDAV